MEKETITLTAEQHSDLCSENSLELDGQEVEIMEDKYIESHRHTELHNIVFKRHDGKFFSVPYETSVKDSMGWEDCNYGDKFSAHEVLPEEIKTIIYK